MQSRKKKSIYGPKQEEIKKKDVTEKKKVVDLKVEEKTEKEKEDIKNRKRELFSRQRKEKQDLKIIHIPKIKNLLADFLSRKQHQAIEGPEIPRHAPLPAHIAVISEGQPIDFKLVNFSSKAAEDQTYQDIIQAPPLTLLSPGMMAFHVHIRLSRRMASSDTTRHAGSLACRQ